MEEKKKTSLQANRCENFNPKHHQLDLVGLSEKDEDRS